MKTKFKNKLRYLAAGIFMIGLIANVSLSLTDPFVFIGTDLLAQTSSGTTGQPALCIETFIFESGKREIRGDKIMRDQPGSDIHEGYVQTCEGSGTGCQPQDVKAIQGCYTEPSF